MDHLPEGFLSARADTLFQLLGGPTLIQLCGQRSGPMFVSVLQHGNENSGLVAVQRLLREYEDKPLPRDLSLFVGNVEAAEAGLRRLENQPDFNRMWPGQEETQCPEAQMMQTVYDELSHRDVFMSIDIHNNTGHNPHYACVNKIDPTFLYLASLFTDTCVYFIEPTGVQSLAFAELCPSVTLECGKAGEEAGIQRVYEFLQRCLQLTAWPRQCPLALNVFHMVAVVKIPEDVSFGFNNGQAQVDFLADLDQLNFRDLKKHTLLAQLRTDEALPLVVQEIEGGLATRKYFVRQEGTLKTAKPMVLAMLTLDSTVIRQDCLCYVMEHYPIPEYWL